MAYVQFEDGVPVASGTINELCTDTRNNLEAVRDAVVMGVARGWNYARDLNGGTAEQPGIVRYSKGNQRIMAYLTWGTTGGSDGNVTVAIWWYIPDTSATTWASVVIGTETISYDTSANVVSSVWS